MNYAIPQRPIHEWAVEDRPREKMLEKGIQSLSDAELIATMLATGTRDQSAIELARTVIDCFGGLPNLSRAEARELMNIPGIGQAKATTILAAFEIARRRIATENRPQRYGTSTELAKYLIPKIGDRSTEVFYALFLDKQNQIVAEKELYHGGVNYVSVDVHHLFRLAIANTASSVVVAHNHPSGRELPSRVDDDLTQHMVSLSRVVGIVLLDHLVVTDRRWYSYADQGVLELMRNRADQLFGQIPPIRLVD
jgi:DNA repair protein RadC